MCVGDANDWAPCSVREQQLCFYSTLRRRDNQSARSALRRSRSDVRPADAYAIFSAGRAEDTQRHERPVRGAVPCSAAARKPIDPIKGGQASMKKRRRQQPRCPRDGMGGCGWEKASSPQSRRPGLTASATLAKPDGLYPSCRGSVLATPRKPGPRWGWATLPGLARLCTCTYQELKLGRKTAVRLKFLQTFGDHGPRLSLLCLAEVCHHSTIGAESLLHHLQRLGSRS
jgi:hypothetical protein